MLCLRLPTLAALPLHTMEDLCLSFTALGMWRWMLGPPASPGGCGVSPRLARVTGRSAARSALGHRACHLLGVFLDHWSRKG